MPYFELIIMYYHVKIACYHSSKVWFFKKSKALCSYTRDYENLRSFDLTMIQREKNLFSKKVTCLYNVYNTL